MITWGQMPDVKLPHFITAANSIKQKPSLQTRGQRTKV